MKPHRQSRFSKRVSSETGVAIVTREQVLSNYQRKLSALKEILNSCPPSERRALLADLTRELTS